MAERRPLVMIDGLLKELPPADTLPATPPNGGAGGVLSGSYPNPGFAVDMATQGELDAHTANTANPHGVTKAQVGLGNVDNTADSAKPVSTAQQTALDTKQAALVSGSNIKTVNGNSLLGSGNLSITAGISDAPSDGKTYGRKDAAWIEVIAGGGMPSHTYDQRGSLRASGGQFAVVDGLGLFQHVAGSDEPDDDESCFATATGRWLLQAAHWDLVDAWQLPEFDERDAYDEDEPLRFVSSFASKVLTGSATCAITSVATVASTSFTGTVTGAAVGDRVIATPPAALGADAAGTGRLGYHAWVSAANTVTVMLTNASASSANTNVAIHTAWPITVIKS